MASLKDLKNRIKSVKSTQKITKAMKMVAAAKLRRAQERAENSRPYSAKMAEIISALAVGFKSNNANLLTGTGSTQKQLVIVATSSRGLCGGFNSTISRAAVAKVNSLVAEGKDVKIICLGRKGYDALKRNHKNRIIEVLEELQKGQVAYAETKQVADKVIELFEAGQVDVATIIYNKFQSVISQKVTLQQLVPLEVPANQNASAEVYEFEPTEEQILTSLLPKNLAVQIYSAMLESQASEQGARMSAMDNATRNAGEMIKKLTLVYNRTRQAAITKELIEIISGAEAI
jgi:F-type H+-transporting ATPase subunit gamma